MIVIKVTQGHINRAKAANSDIIDPISIAAIDQEDSDIQSFWIKPDHDEVIIDSKTHLIDLETQRMLNLWRDGKVIKPFTARFELIVGDG